MIWKIVFEKPSKPVPVPLRGKLSDMKKIIVPIFLLQVIFANAQDYKKSI